MYCKYTSDHFKIQIKIMFVGVPRVFLPLPFCQYNHQDDDDGCQDQFCSESINWVIVVVNGLSLTRHQAITWANAYFYLLDSWELKFNDISNSD